jgi:hypothetical protein
MQPQASFPSRHQNTTSDQPQRAGESVGRDIIQVEANLLCFPFFALAKRDRAERLAIEVFGTRMREGTSQRFSLRVSRNVDYPYPGPLSRKVHFAFLDLLADRPRPLENPVTWKWRDLHNRIGIEYAGRTSIASMKQAIHSTAAVYITTTCGLIVKRGDDKSPLPERETGYHLYDKVVFVNDVLPDGRVSDQNAVWLSDWYLANLNELYSGPVNYDLWKRLDAAHQIASRLYEFLLFKCSRKVPLLRINYPYLASFLPVRIEPCLSKAKEQLEPALRTLGTFHVLKRVEWTRSQTGQMQLLLHPGPALSRNFAPITERDPVPRDILEFSDLHVVEVLHEQSKEQQLVCRYHALRFNRSRYTPTPAELDFARDKLAVYNEELLNLLLPKITEAMEREFPKGKYFSAAGPYIDEILAEHLTSQAERRRRQEEDRLAHAKEHQVDQAKEARKEYDKKLIALFESLSSAAKEKIWQEAIAAAPSKFDRDQLHRARKGGKSHFVLLQVLDQHQRKSSRAS